MTVPAGYTLKNKAIRNKLIRNYKKEHPNIKLRELKELFGISMARLSTIIAKKVKSDVK